MHSGGGDSNNGGLNERGRFTTSVGKERGHLLAQEDKEPAKNRASTLGSECKPSGGRRQRKKSLQRGG